MNNNIEITTKIRDLIDLIDFESLFNLLTGFLIRNFDKIMQEIILRIRDLIDCLVFLIF